MLDGSLQEKCFLSYQEAITSIMIEASHLKFSSKTTVLKFWKIWKIKLLVEYVFNNLFHPSVVFDIETSHPICSENQTTNFYMKRNRD